MTSKIIPVSEYNRRQRIKYESARQDFREGKRKQPPFLPMFLFVNEKTGEPRKKGFVRVDNNRARFSINKKNLRNIT